MSEPTEPVTVLLVEDNDGDAFLIQHALKGSTAPPFRLVRARDLASAQTALAGGIDVVLLDLGLPDSEGTPTLIGLRNAAAGAALVVLTGRDDDDLAHTCLELGAQDYVGKNDMTPHNLRRVIGYAMSRAREARSRDAEVRELQRALADLRAISSHGAATTVTAGLAGLGPLASREPDTFAVLATEYAAALQVLTGGAQPDATDGWTEPRRVLARSVTRLGSVGGGPRDLVDLHLAAFELLRSSVPRSRLDQMVTDGRQIALEAMGHLVDFYRTGVRARP